MKREVSVSVFAVLVVAAAILTVYYLNVSPTGFAVFEQNTQSAFNEGSYSNVTYNSNLSAVVLAVNQSSGTYMSKIFDADSSSAVWNNLTWQGSGVTFKVRNCTNSDCSSANFTTVSDLNNLNLSGQYFQYQAGFDSVNDTLKNVTIDYTVAQQATPVSILISQPSGEKTSASGISLTFTTTGDDLTCSYIVKVSENGAVVIPETSIEDCASTTFDLPDEDESYIVTVNVEGPNGEASNSSAFSVLVSSTTSTSEEETTEENTTPAEEESIVQVPLTVTKVSLESVSTQDIIQGSSKQFTVSVQNEGTVPLSSCVLSGDDSGWFSIATGAINLGAGETSGLSFLVNVPESASLGEHTLGLSVDCAETSATQTFTLNVLQKKLDFNITNVQRTREDRVRVDYSLTELAGEDQDVEIYFAIKDASGLEVANTSQNSSIGANKTNDFRVNIPINETVNGTMTLVADFNSQVYSSSVLEPIDLSTITGSAILGGIGGVGGIIIIVIVVLALMVMFFIARRMRQSGKTLKDVFKFKE